MVVKNFPETEQHTIHVERLDSLVKATMGVRVTKLDAQGFECRILEGMGPELASQIHVLHFEWATKWLQGQECLDLLDKVRQLGFEIHRDGLDGPIVTESSLRGFMDLTAKQTKPYVPRN